VGVRVGVAYSRDKFSIFDSFRDIRDHILDFFKVCGRGKNYLSQLIGIDENNTFQLKFLY